MNAKQQQDLLWCGYVLILFGLPLLLMLVPLGASWLQGGFTRFCLAVFVSWSILQVYHGALIRPISFQRAREQGEMLYDGTGAGAATVILGLIVPALLGLLVLGLQWVVRRLRFAPQ